MTLLDAAPGLTPLLMPSWMDPEKIVSAAGPYALWVVAFIVFAECGIFSILPGDSLLFTVGMLTAGGLAGGKPAIHYFDSHVGTLVLCIVVLTLAAILGNVTGYYLGRLIGPPLFKPRKGLVGKIFDPHYVDVTHGFFDKYGPRALVLARFVPMVRTFVTLVAGIADMRFRTFIRWTGLGGVLWVLIVTVLGFFLGQISLVRNNIEVALALIVVFSLIPMAIEYFMGRRNRGSSDSSDEPAADAATLSDAEIVD